MKPNTGALSVVGFATSIVLCVSFGAFIYSRFTFKQESRPDAITLTLVDDNKSLRQQIVKVEQQLLQANTQIQGLAQAQTQLSSRAEAAAQAAAQAQAQSATCRPASKSCP